MVMIDRMFIQEEKTTLALDKQLAKEKPGERGREGEGSPVPAPAMEFDLGAGSGVHSLTFPHHWGTPAPHLPAVVGSTLTSGLWGWRELSSFSSIPVSVRLHPGWRAHSTTPRGTEKRGRRAGLG